MVERKEKAWTFDGEGELKNSEAPFLFAQRCVLRAVVRFGPKSVTRVSMILKYKQLEGEMLGTYVMTFNPNPKTIFITNLLTKLQFSFKFQD